MLCFGELKGLYGLKRGDHAVKGKKGFQKVSNIDSTEQILTEDEIAKEVTSQKLNKKLGVTDHKTPSVSNRYCCDCPYSEVHGTGSTLWTSCKFQSGWRSLDSQCNLPDSEFLRLSENHGDQPRRTPHDDTAPNGVGPFDEGFTEKKEIQQP